MAEITPSHRIDGVILVRPDVHHDERGRFVETYRREWLAPGREEEMEKEKEKEMVQANLAERSAGTIVGLHYHLRQADYWHVVRGHARVVLHDLRCGGPTDGATLVLDMGEVEGGANDHLGVYIPPGVAHGFASLTDLTLTYLVDAYYDPSDELGVAWDDPAVTADWGLIDPVLSARDRTNPGRDAIDPRWRPRAGRG